MRKSSLLIASAAPVVLASPYVGHLSAYANTLTNLIGDLYAGLDVVSRELVGMVPSVGRDSGAERAAVGQSVTYHIAPAANVSDITPAMQVPEPTDQTIGNGQIVITKARAANFGWTGEEERGVNANGPGALSIQADQFAQGLRALTNEIESDLCQNAIYASRAWGTAGTTPFASDLGDIAQVRKILDDNGAPPSERSLVMNTSAGAKLRTLGQLTKANEAGTTMTLRDGELLNVHNISLKESAGVINFVKGTAAGSTTNAAGYAAGATTITLASAGTGTIKAGDVVTFNGDTNAYLVVSGDTDVSNGGSITIAAPGLRQAIAASATAITVVGNHACNIGFSRNAIHLVTRAPALPAAGDAAVDRQQLVDPRSGLVFEVSLYAGYRKFRAEVAAAWGTKAVKTEHIALLLG